MTLNVDHAMDRRRMRRKVTFWRVLGVAALLFALAGLWAAYGGANYVEKSSAHVARVTIGGLIRNDKKRVELLEEIEKSGAQAVILVIDSPGGTVAGSEQLYNALRKLAAKKPVVAVVEGTAASGAYIAAMGADRIFAPRGAIVGSIGVIFQYPNLSGLLKNVGVNVEAIRSTPLKAMPSGVEPTPPEAQAAIRALVEDNYTWFKSLVQERRALDNATLLKASDGRVFTASQALPLRLIDEIGDEKSAREWLEKNKKVSKDLKARDWRVTTAGSEFRWLGALAPFADSLGLSSLAAALANEGVLRAAAQAQLDGLLALWHPQIAN
ncbi:MAG: signal peptide peptidase SppA [Xanthobacteraceae bacterium]|nr:signal peptide peptidase SppA [Xanthobacteraceae bacterium]QYK45064.1 MAG: signal peptide peptidase SppA [Xanthobacteraceae bacterium]